MVFCTTSQPLSRRSAIRLGSVGLVALLATQAFGCAQARELSTLETNKAIARDLFELGVNLGDEAQVAAFYAPTYVDRGTWARQLPGPAGMPMPLHEFRELFPDVTVTVDTVVAEEDLVTTSVTWHGTHPPAGMHVVGRTMHLFRLANEQIIEEWSTGWDWITRHARKSAPRSTNPLAGTVAGGPWRRPADC